MSLLELMQKAVTERAREREIEVPLNPEASQAEGGLPSTLILSSLSNKPAPGLKAYLQEIQPYHYFRLNAHQEKYYAQCYQTLGDKAARQLLLQANVWLVVSLALRYQGKGVDLLDLIQEGNLGILQAIEKYDYTAHTRLSTYASWWILREIRNTLSVQSRTVRLPLRMAESMLRLQRANNDLQKALGRTPTLLELATQLNWAVARVA